MNLMNMFSMALQASSSTFMPTGATTPAWQQFLQTPYVQDTLAQLVGPAVTVRTPFEPPVGRPELRGVTSQQGDTITLFGRKPEDNYFTHEIGHVLDTRNRAPEVSGQVAQLAQGQRRSDYAGQNDFEYVAEAFRTAMEHVRKYPDLTERAKRVAAADKRLPGVALWADWIQRQLAPQNVAGR